LLLVSWLWLAHAAGYRVPLRGHTGILLFSLAFSPVLIAPVVYLMEPVVSAAHHQAFTELMRFGGLALLPLGLVVVAAVLSRARPDDAPQRPLRAALLSSLLLFTAGGVLGFLIRGANVVIPAHYHGSIVGVTLAFMGMAYLLLPRLGYAAPSGRLPTWQPWIYGSGQLLHILGLAISGGYGNIQRKTAGGAQGLHNLPEILGMGMMGLGGLIAIIGGLLFVIVMVRALWFLPRE
jgi:heme/copper-type cytochrome/quinol oxidase subunit 1